ncbi:MAG: hypothetical protein HDT44_08865 [Ruminococcaceae bacterium]|nr:hypothetical protein [Oscillospiraceae bacterium]
MQDATVNPNTYTIVMENELDLSEKFGIPPELSTRSKISRITLAAVEDRLEAYGVCVLDFGSKCISQLEDWENHFKKNMAYRISRDSNTLTVRKNINEELI